MKTKKIKDVFEGAIKNECAKDAYNEFRKSLKLYKFKTNNAVNIDYKNEFFYYGHKNRHLNHLFFMEKKKWAKNGLK